MKKGTPILWNSVISISIGRLVASVLICAGIFTAQVAPAQCTQAQLNWDHLDYYFNSGGSNGPYESYVSDAREQTQKYAIGKTWLSIVTSSNALVNPGVGNYSRNGLHTGDIANFTGDDVQYNPSAINQTITITFATEVENTSFTLYDIDGGSRIDIDAFNAANVAQNVDITTYPSSILSITGDNNINTFVSAGAGTTGNASNTGTATAAIATAINRIVITVTTVGSDAVFWLSDINACVVGSFPTNYHQTAAPNLQPFTGPVANQPQYFLATPDNDGIYMVDPATGNAKYIDQDASKDYVNSFAYDPVNRILYYISENVSVNSGNKELKKYDFNTGSSSQVIADITTTLGITTFSMGVESAGAAWYDGALYLGIEGGKSTSGADRTRRSIVWRIDFDASQNPVNAYQVYATDAYNPAATGTSIHDWGDFLIKDGVLIDFNTARSGTCGTCYAESKYHHFDLTTGQETVYTNPSNTQYSGQGGLSWSGELYWLRTTVGKYNGDGTLDPTTYPLVVVPGPNGIGPYATWQGGTGDASDPFRPKSDFGDAPASYDPNPQSPAVHELDTALRLGASAFDEWVLTSSSLADAEGAEEDAIGAAPQLDFDATLTYTVLNIRVLNNTGANATLAGWLDYNFDGVFDAGEGVTLTIPSSASDQFVSLSWNNIWVEMTTATQTFLRLRLTRSANGMTAANGMNGWFPDGEVEDWPVLIGSALPKDIQSFSLGKKDNSVDVRWSINVQQMVDNFEVYRSNDNINWGSIATINANDGFGLQQYLYNDADPFPGTSYYRIRVNYRASGSNKYSGIKSVRFDNGSPLMKVLPNPASSYAEIQLTAAAKGNATIEVFDQSGRKLFSQQKTVETGLNRIVLNNLATYSAGIYMVRVKMDGRVLNSKLVINK